MPRTLPLSKLPRYGITGIVARSANAIMIFQHEDAVVVVGTAVDDC